MIQWTLDLRWNDGRFALTRFEGEDLGGNLEVVGYQGLPSRKPGEPIPTFEQQPKRQVFRPRLVT